MKNPFRRKKPTGMSARWRGAAEFAEYAETLDVETYKIFGVVPVPGDAFVVIFTPDCPLNAELDEMGDAFSVMLGRDDDGILREIGPRLLLDDFADQLASCFEVES